MSPVIMIMGPTASGKTDLAIEVARHFNGEIISVDSALIYRDMDIGTAKPSPEQLAMVPHHLIDVLDPAQAYSAADFHDDALCLIEQIHSRGRLPVLAGGTMLYFRALLDGLAQLPAADEEVRRELEAEAAVVGWPAMHAKLAEVDPVTAARLHPTDPQRIGRALEVWRVSGKPLSQWHAEQEERPFPYRAIKLALWPEDREELRQRIAIRFRQMLEDGLIDEVARLRARGDLDLSMPSMRCVGYRQVWEYLDGAFDYEAMIKQGVAATRQLAKRQLTWLRKEPELTTFPSRKPLPVAEVVAWLEYQLGK